ncbi:fasciclin-like arabinogalactan protein 11 [Olea europaea var. sylvestris]|uniref:FAS1 domain-containing protein n=1 Tax=Olea europaea subsp. europaea TaxID=158383 RepID=A0A8S0PJK5_OLEEU|nr:fasciclin-like arabinogalactan protein 11 [Olea europaea var. sylvestris]CAA2953293.1 Hypothetical predicted protein [Olea europaea subsp. europaea]
MKQFFLTFPLLFSFLFFFQCTPALSQSPAPAPAPPALVPAPPALSPASSGSTDVTAILGKVGHFATFIRLLKASQLADQLNTQLYKSNQGLTVFAPTDAAFANLKSGTLNSLTDQQKYQLVQFHVLPSFFSVSQFQTASNPLRTQAGGSDGQFPLNVTTTGNQVNITTDMVNATVTDTVYTDRQLAVYEVDKVLLPHGLFVPPPPPPTAPLKSKQRPASESTQSNDTPHVQVDTSSGIQLSQHALRATSSIFLVLAAFI